MHERPISLEGTGSASERLRETRQKEAQGTAGMTQDFTPSRRDVLKLSASGIGSAIFGSLMPASMPSAANAAPLTFGSNWEASVHRASYIHEHLGRFHYDKIFTTRAPLSTEREALVFLGKFAASIHSALRVQLSDGASLFERQALARQCEETRTIIRGLSPTDRTSYWNDISFWQNEGCYGINASEWAFHRQSTGKPWQVAVDEYFAKLERDLVSYEQYVRHLASEASRSKNLLDRMDTPIATMGREWLDLFSRGRISDLRENQDFKALAAIAQTVLPAPEYDRYGAASTEELKDSIEHLASRGVSRVELELLGEADTNYRIYSRFLTAAHAAEATLEYRKVADTPPLAIMRELARSFDEAIALARPPGEDDYACTTTLAHALSRAERLLLWGFNDGYGGTDSGFEPKVRRNMEAILLDIWVDNKAADRTRVLTSRDRVSGGRFYDSIWVSVELSSSAAPSERHQEVIKAMAERLRVPEDDVQCIPPTRKYGQHRILIKGLSAKELTERLG
jgi:hypothetical protein